MGRDGTRVASPIPADSSLGGSVQTRRVCPPPVYQGGGGGEGRGGRGQLAGAGRRAAAGPQGR